MEGWSLKGRLRRMTVAKKGKETLMFLQIPSDYGTGMEEGTPEHILSLINFD